MIDSIAARASGLVGSKAVGRGLERRGLDLLHADADLAQQLADIGKLEQHADRADQGRVLRHDVVGRDRRDIAARGREPIDHDHHRLAGP